MAYGSGECKGKAGVHDVVRGKADSESTAFRELAYLFSLKTAIDNEPDSSVNYLYFYPRVSLLLTPDCKPVVSFFWSNKTSQNTISARTRR